MLEALGHVARTLGIVLFIIAALGQFASQLALWHFVSRIKDVSNRLGGDPPAGGTWGLDSEPKFWDYVRTQCHKPGTEELQQLVRKADVLLLIRAVTLVAAIAIFVAAVIMNWH